MAVPSSVNKNPSDDTYVIVATANDGNGGIDTDTATVADTGSTGVAGSWGVAPGSQQAWRDCQSSLLASSKGATQKPLYPHA